MAVTGIDYGLHSFVPVLSSAVKPCWLQELNLQSTFRLCKNDTEIERRKIINHAIGGNKTATSQLMKFI